LAFLWLIVTVLIQQHELGLQRESIAWQAMELSNSVEQLSRQTDIMKEQAKLAQRERDLRQFEDEYTVLSKQFRDVMIILQGRHSLRLPSGNVFLTFAEIGKISECIFEKNFAGVFDSFLENLRSLNEEHGINFGQIQIQLNVDRSTYSRAIREFIHDYSKLVDRIQSRNDDRAMRRLKRDGATAAYEVFVDILRSS